MPQISVESVVVTPNEIRLVRRPDTERWQAHYKVEALGRWVRKATGTADIDKAKAKAMEFAVKAKILAEAGHPVVSKKFKAAADIVQRDLEEKIAADKTKRGSNNDYVSAIKLYLTPFFGSYNVDRINQQVYNQFCEWRTKEVGRELSQSAQSNHNAALNLVFDYCIERGYMTSMQKPMLKNTGEASGRRPDFSAKEVKAMCEHMPAWVNEPRLERSCMIRELLSVYVPFAAATGMRPGTEMDYLEWRHITVVPPAQGSTEPGLIAHIQKGKTVKKGKFFTARLDRSCWILLAKLVAMSEDFAGKTLFDVLQEKPAKLVFRMSDGTQPNQLTKQFKQLLVDMNLLLCPITQQERTLYSLRHYAITQMVLKGHSDSLIAQQVRTSPAMINKFYNHVKPQMHGAFSGVDDMVEGDDVSVLLQTAPNDDMLYFAELSTGISLSLAMQNKPELDELRQELASNKSAQPT